MEARERKTLASIIRNQRWAALGTSGEGGALASMAAYAPEADFSGFLLLLSTLSLHTRNLLADPRVSLAVSEPDRGEGNPQTLSRVSIQGDAAPIRRETAGYAGARALYERRFPSSTPLFGFGDFLLFRLVPREARYVAGFGRAYTLSADDLREAGNSVPAVGD